MTCRVSAINSVAHPTGHDPHHVLVVGDHRNHRECNHFPMAWADVQMAPSCRAKVTRHTIRARWSKTIWSPEKSGNHRYGSVCRVVHWSARRWLVYLSGRRGVCRRGSSAAQKGPPKTALDEFEYVLCSVYPPSSGFLNCGCIIQKSGFASPGSRSVHLPHNPRPKGDRNVALRRRIRRRSFRTRLLDIQILHLRTKNRNLPPRKGFQPHPLSGPVCRMGTPPGGTHTPSRWREGRVLEVLGPVYEIEDLDFGSRTDSAQVGCVFGR